MKAKNLDTGHLIEPRALNWCVFFPILWSCYCQGGKDSGKILAVGQLGRSETEVHVSEVLSSSWLVGLQGFPGLSWCQDTTPLPEGADRAGPSILAKLLESNNSIHVSTPYFCGTLRKLLNLSEAQLLYLENTDKSYTEWWRPSFPGHPLNFLYYYYSIELI